MSERYKYTLEIVLEHLLICEKRFSEIHIAQDFVASEYGTILLDAIAARLQAIGENCKGLMHSNPEIEGKYPEIEWNKLIRFRDFISHHYEKLDYEIIFEICSFDLPELKNVIVKELAQLKKT